MNSGESVTLTSDVTAVNFAVKSTGALTDTGLYTINSESVDRPDIYAMSNTSAKSGAVMFLPKDTRVTNNSGVSACYAAAYSIFTGTEQISIKKCDITLVPSSFSFV